MLRTNALQQQGADPFIGRRLRALLNRTASVDVEIGILGGEWHDAMKEEHWGSEWMMKRPYYYSTSPIEKHLRKQSGKLFPNQDSLTGHARTC